MNQLSVKVDMQGVEQRGRGPAMTQAELEALVAQKPPGTGPALREDVLRAVLEDYVDFGVEQGVISSPDAAPNIDAYIESFD